MKIVDINGTKREVKKAYPDPDYPGFMRIEFKRHHEWYSIQEFLQFNPDLEDLTASAPKVPEDIVGIVSSAGKDYLRDIDQNLKENAYLGFFVWISRGKGEGQKRTVTKNTHNKITVDKPWDDKPNKTSQYVLSHNVQEVHAMGNISALGDMKDLEIRAIDMDKKYGRLDSQQLKKNIKYLDPDDI